MSTFINSENLSKTLLIHKRMKEIPKFCYFFQHHKRLPEHFYSHGRFSEGRHKLREDFQNYYCNAFIKAIKNNFLPLKAAAKKFQALITLNNIHTIIIAWDISCKKLFCMVRIFNIRCVRSIACPIEFHPLLCLAALYSRLLVFARSVNPF